MSGYIAAIAENRQPIRLPLPMRIEKRTFLAESPPRRQSMIVEMRFFRNCGRGGRENRLVEKKIDPREKGGRTQ